MPGYVLGQFFLYCVMNAFTPGPGNILALNTVTNYGLKGGRRLFSGIFVGYYIVQILCALFVFGISTFLPGMLLVMRYVGAAYILWLAVHIAVSRPEFEDEGRSASFVKGFLLQFVNVKIYLFGITALTGFVTDYSRAFWILLGFEMVIATIGTIATSTWIGLGAALRKLYVRHYRGINILLALTLLECVVSMLM